MYPLPVEHPRDCETAPTLVLVPCIWGLQSNLSKGGCTPGRSDLFSKQNHTCGSCMPPAKLADGCVEGWCEYESKDGHAEHPEQHGSPERLAHLCAGSGRDCERRDAHDESERGHQNGPKSSLSRVGRSFLWGFAIHIFSLFRKLYDQDCVLRGQTDQNHEANLSKNVDRHAPQTKPRSGTKKHNRE